MAVNAPKTELLPFEATVDVELRPPTPPAPTVTVLAPETAYDCW
jgi:hypothetical protein